jgi:hypothetical protein
VTRELDHQILSFDFQACPLTTACLLVNTPAPRLTPEPSTLWLFVGGLVLLWVGWMIYLNKVH